MGFFSRKKEKDEKKGGLFGKKPSVKEKAKPASKLKEEAAPEKKLPPPAKESPRKEEDSGRIMTAEGFRRKMKKN